MSVQSTARYAGPFAGNGVTTVFAFGFKVFAASDIVVASTVTATGVVSNPVNGVDYTVQLNADQNVNPGGTITYAVAPPATVSPIYITSSIPKAQLSSFPNPGPWNPTTGESAWDKSMTLIQEIGQAALLFAPGDVASTHVLPTPAARALKFPFFDATGALTLAAAVSTAAFVGTVQAGQLVFGSAGGLLNQDANLVWDNVNKRLGIGVAVPTVALDVLGTGKFSTSVVTPLLTTGGAVNLALGINGASNWIIPAGTLALRPAADNSQDFGDPAFRIGHVFTPIIDSGTTGSLSLKTNNGQTQITVEDVGGTAANRLRLNGALTGQVPQIGVGGEANTGLLFYTLGTGAFSFFTAGAAAQQFQVLHTASANQNPTATGGNGVNSKIGTTAGGLDFTSATIRYPNIGTTAVAANATLNAVGSNDLLRSTSSIRYKTEIEALSHDEALTLLRKLNPITYASLCEQDSPYLRHSGFIAEDVHAINPLFVSFSMSATGNKRPESVQYERLTVPLVAGWQDHDARLAALEARIH